MKTVPLRYRLPNPPADFVGRQEEVGRIAASLKEAHVTVLAGPGGVGKTALACHTLHKRFPKRVARTLYLSLSSPLDGLELRRELLRALATAAGEDIEWGRLQDQPEALVEALLDVAESGAFWVVIDDLQHVLSGEGDDLLAALSLYARSSRYLVISRAAPSVELASGRVIAVGGLDEEATLQLARQLAEDRSNSEITMAARASGGSPWLLRQSLVYSASEAHSASPPSHRALLAGLQDDGRKVALVLSRLDVAVPSSLLSHALDVPEERWRPELIARGWLQETPAGVRLHEVARQGMTAGGEFLAEPNLWLPVAIELATNPQSAIRLEGIRLLIEAGALDQAEQALDGSLQQLLTEGYAPQLWKLLGPVPRDRLDGVRLRCAAELGNPTVLRTLKQPLGGTATDRLTWAETLFLRGDLFGALEAVRSLIDDPSAAPDVVSCRFEASLLQARILIAQDKPEQARHLLTELVPVTSQQTTHRDVLLHGYAPFDRSTDADRHNALVALRNVEQRCGELQGSARARVRFHLAAAYLRYGALDLAEGVLDASPLDEAGDTLALFESRMSSWLRAAVDVARGRLASAQERLEQLEPFLSSPSLMRAEVQCTRARLWMARGEFGELLSLLREASSEATSLGILATAHHCERLIDRVEELLLLGPGRQRAEARSERFLKHPEGRIRELENALRQSELTMVRAAEHRAELCTALLLLGRDAELEREVGELRTLAFEMSSPRWLYEAELLSMFRELDFARLEEIAQRPLVNPVACRRARSLLGATEVTDPLDVALVEKLRGRTAPRLVVPAPESEDWQPGWGLDVPRRRIWLPSGKWLDLSRRTLLARLLGVLASRNGSATKEQLVEEVWHETEYHPLRHDTRLQVTVHKLRELLEDDPGSPRFLLTSSSGYSLAGPFRMLPDAEAVERLEASPSLKLGR